GPGNGTDALRPDRIREDVDIACLDEKRRMIDEGDSQIGDAARGSLADRTVEIAPCPSPARPHPFQKVAESSKLDPGVVEALAVEVLRLRNGRLRHKAARRISSEGARAPEAPCRPRKGGPTARWRRSPFQRGERRKQPF